MRLNKNNIDNVYKSKPLSVETMELKGYSLITELFCDSSGLGSDNESALTSDSLRKELNSLINEYGTIYTTITNAGQFQVYIGVFIKDKTQDVTIINKNVFERRENNKLIIRLYDTDIVTIEGNKYTLNTGGYNTMTTNKWINKYLPTGCFVYRKNFQEYIQINDNKTLPFVDDCVSFTY